MKKILVAVFFTLITAAMALSQTQLVVEMNNGEKHSFQTDEVKKLYFEEEKNDIRFGLTSHVFQHNQDLDAACKSEFGASSRVADWTDIEAYYARTQSLSGFFADLGLAPYKSNGWREIGAFVTNGRKDFYSGTRHYFITRHDGNRPSHYKTHDTIHDRELDLGSWQGTGPVLCVE